MSQPSRAIKTAGGYPDSSVNQKSKENLTVAIESGKRRGYDEVRVIESTSYLFQYAVKKQADGYETYILRIDDSKSEAFEDYAEEETRTFLTLNEAFEHLKASGADVEKLSAIKRPLPF